MPLPSAPEVDYASTSARPAWSTLPQAVRTAVGRVAGGRVHRAGAPVGSGFTGAYAGTVELDTGRRVFVKAAPPDQPHVVAALEQEAQVLGGLPDGVPAPALVGAAAVAGWRVLAVEVVPGSMPGAPWTPDDVEAVHRACLAVAEAGTPWRGVGRDLGQRLSADPDILALGETLVDGRFAFAPEQPRWLPRHAPAVGRLVLDATGRFDGETLCHGDLRPDNLLVDRRHGATVVDWNWVGSAAAWVDWIGLLPLMAAQGVDTAALVSTSPLTRGVDPEAIDAYLATIAAYMLGGYRTDPPPGCTPALRRHQLLMAHLFLELLRARRGWSERPPD